jgi:hypothetical protein
LLLPIAFGCVAAGRRWSTVRYRVLLLRRSQPVMPMAKLALAAGGLFLLSALAVSALAAPSVTAAILVASTVAALGNIGFAPVFYLPKRRLPLLSYVLLSALFLLISWVILMACGLTV